MFDYTGKVVAITGASSGLGKQMAEGYAQQGANLVLMARRVERLEASAKEWKEKYGGIILKQLRKLGCSCDWQRERFTMDVTRSAEISANAIMNIAFGSSLYAREFLVTLNASA